MQSYVIWNQYKTGCDTYDELVEKEKDGYSYSSVITVPDITEVLTAVYNESDVDLLWHRIEPKFYY